MYSFLTVLYNCTLSGTVLCNHFHSLQRDFFLTRGEDYTYLWVYRGKWLGTHNLAETTSALNGLKTVLTRGRPCFVLET